MHDDELEVTLGTVRALVGGQFPQWRSLPVSPVASQGTATTIFRLGDRLAARFPRQPQQAQEARREAAAARELLGRTRFATPEPVAVGAPGAGYPLHWSVQTWLPGAVATGPLTSERFAEDLAEFIAGVRAIDPAGRTFTGPGRGGDLREHDPWMETCLARSTALLDVPRLRALWATLRDLPPSEGPGTMNHGDLIPGNILLAGDRLAGVLDVGGLKVADRALDLVGAWHLLTEGPRKLLRERLGCGDVEWERGKAWAFEQAMGLVWYYRDTHPAMSRLGRQTLAHITAASR